MALNYKTYYAIPRFKDYAEAERWERDVKPIRGDENQRKPLGRRDQKWRHIKRLEDGSITITDGWGDFKEEDWYICFRPNGELHLYDVAWGVKATFNEVMQRVTGLTFFTEACRMWVRYDGGHAPVVQRPRGRWVPDPDKPGESMRVYPPTPEATIMVRNERGNWVPKQTKGLVTHRVNHKGANTVRKRYAAGLDYIKALISLRRDNPVKHEEIVKAFEDTLCKDMPQADRPYAWKLHPYLPEAHRYGFKHPHAAQLCALLGSEDPGEQYKAYLWLSRGCVPNDIPKNAERVMMMHHHDEWFKKVEREPGVKAIDRYSWAIPKPGVI